MEVPKPEVVQLTAEEQELLARIPFSKGYEYETYKETSAVAVALTRSLLQRKAVPQIRVRYFTDPDLNIGSTRSRKEVFEKNGTQGEDILRHVHFLPHLRYFIFGPDLPEPVIQGFRDILIDDCGTSGEVRDQLRQFARHSVRRFSLNRKDAAEEFYKLALECGLVEWEAGSVRDAALSTR